MIEVKNLTKVYLSKNKEKVVANNDISFSLGDNGMVFITGKSGSGKSTLLNILGGLDTKTSGEYLIDGKSIETFKSLDSFRNECVGFVFQDFNLIESLSVYENINLVLSLQETKDNEKIKNTLKVVGLDGYENRKINELSGGQKQRVAIARAIIKNSKFILADEPTGNLDSETSLEIFKLLKEISKNKLVIVISHDNANAKKFADRIINLIDGKINSDKKIKDLNTSNANLATNNLTKHKLGFKYTFSMAKNNIFKHFWKSFIALILSTITIFSFCISILFVQFNAETSISQTLKNDFENIYFSQSIYGDSGKSIVFDSYSNVNEVVYDKLSSEDSYLKGFNLGLNSTDTEKYSSNAFYLIESKNDILKMGLEYYFLNEISNDGVYLTDYAIDYLLQNNYVLSDGFSKNDLSQLNGAQILQYNAYTSRYETKYKIDGIIKTDYKQFLDKKLNIKTDNLYEFRSESSFKEFVRQKIALKYIPFYCTQTYINESQDLSKIDLTQTNSTDIDIVSNDKNVKFTNISILAKNLYDYDTINDSGKIVSAKSITLADDEILINLKLYNQLFDNEISFERLTTYTSFNQSNEKICSYTFNHLSEEISFKYFNNCNQKSLLELKDKKIVGVVIKDYFMQQTDGCELYTNKSVIKENTILSNINNVVFERFSTFSSFNEKLNLFRSSFNIGVYGVKIESIYNFENMSNALMFIFISLSVIFVAISLLVSTYVISFSISSRKKEIGILRALGTTSKDVEKIYIYESLIIGIFTFVLALAITFLGVSIINNILCLGLCSKIIYLIANPLLVLIIFAMSIILNVLSCLIPTKKINSLNPIDSIKSIE